ncbi:MAG: SDR family oxidoreductase [Actinobacteria bacterium]|nr:SDR family oxidoreductase [Actinomycetota bacterium]
MDVGLKGKKALITGGGSGIGKAIALELAKEGVHIAVASRNPDPEAIDEISSYGVKVLRIVADVSREEDVVRMVNEAIEGLEGLDLYINNAAAHWDEAVTKITADGWMNSINTNLSACIWACREVAKYFISQHHGSILIVGSIAMYTAHPTETSYRVSKTGLKPFMELLAVELAPFGIRANMLAPGLFPTRVSAHVTKKQEAILSTIPLRRAGDLDHDIGPAAVFLLSDKLSAYITGSELVVDGGTHVYPYPMYSDKELRELNL